MPCRPALRTSEPAGPPMQTRATISDNYLAQQRELHKNPHNGVASLGYAPWSSSCSTRPDSRPCRTTARANAICRRGCTISASGISNTCPTPGLPRLRPAQTRPACVLHRRAGAHRRALSGGRAPRPQGHHPEYRMLLRPHRAGGEDPARRAQRPYHPEAWWLPRLCQHFEIGHLQRGAGGFWVIAEPKLPS